jgi:hypothetical protein
MLFIFNLVCKLQLDRSKRILEKAKTLYKNVYTNIQMLDDILMVLNNVLFNARFQKRV